MRDALDEARRRGRMSDGPFRGRPLGNWFARKMEPPVKRRFKTMSALEPPKTLDPTTVRTDFSRCRDELIDLVRGGEGVDFDRATIRSPYLRLLRMPVSSACNVLLAHARRHIWLARRALATSGKTSD
jgi:hypothetical protein